MKATFWLASACLVAVAAGCRDNTLAVEDLNNPDVSRVFATPSGIEATIAAGYQTAHNAVTNTSDLPSLITIDAEQYSQLNNFSMGPRGSIPRNPIQNPRGSSGIFSDFSAESRGARLMVNAINALDALRASGGTTGSALPLTPTTYANQAADSAQDMRDRAWGWFILAMDEANLAMEFDSAAIVTPGMKSDVIPPLSDKYAVMTQVMADFDSAYAIASKQWGNAGFTSHSDVPATWTSSAALTTGSGTAGFPRLIRSWQAYFRANVARNAADRADISQGGKVDWAKVVDEAENFGITSDFTPTVSIALGYNRGYASQGGGNVDPTWGQVNPFFYGMADTSGAYRSQLYGSVAARGLFLIQTPDLRFPSGGTRAAQQAFAKASSRKALTYNSLPYIVNRTTADGTGDSWGVSEYDNYRLQYIPLNSNVGVYPDLMQVTLRLLAAEGHFRLPALAGGVAKGLSEIDVSRVNAGLPPLTGTIVAAAVPTAPPGVSTKVATSGGAVPGGTACVPQVPYVDMAATNATNTTTCGDAWEALKYEYRMETEYTGFAMWFFYNRGFNDLIDGTAYEWPVPSEEMDARYGASVIKFYNLGGDASGKFSSNTGNTYHNFRMF